MYEVRILRRAMRDILRLPREDARRVSIRIDALSATPRPPGVRKLRGAEGLFRLRVGDYRILYEVDDAAQVVTVYRVRHRREAYR